MKINHYYDLIPHDAHAVHWTVSSVYYSESQLFRVGLAITAIALAIINIPLYVCQTLATSEWQNLEEVGKSLLFVIITVAAIFASFYQDDIFAPPEVLEEEIPKPPPIEPKPSSVVISQPSLVAAVISFSPAQVVATYDSLPMTQAQEEALGNIVLTLATKWFFNPLTLISNGETLKGLHPLRFIGFCIDPIQKNYLRQIRYGGDGKIEHDKRGAIKSGFYWEQFVGPLADSMKTHLAQGTVLPYIENFAATFGVESAAVRGYLDPLNCEGLVDYLLGR